MELDCVDRIDRDVLDQEIARLSAEVVKSMGAPDVRESLGRQGFEVSIAPVTSEGRVDPATIAELVGHRTILVSVMTVNNEIGTIQDLKTIGDAVRDKNAHTLVHTDAVQALGNVPVDLHAWGVDLAAFAAHKLGGPKGVGALFVRSGVAVDPTVHGGGQERGLRSGTLNVAGIAGFGLAALVTDTTADLEEYNYTRALERTASGAPSEPARCGPTRSWCAI